MKRKLAVLVCAVGALAVGLAVRADELEMRDGRVLVGKVIERTGTHVQFRVVFPGGGSAEMSIPAVDVKSIKEGPLPEPPKVEPKPPAPSAPDIPDPDDPPPPGMELPAAPTAPPPDPTAPGPGGVRTRAQIDALIDQLGKAPPDWWDSVPLNYPKTLDLSWPDKPPGPWDPNKNVGQYFWSVINENPGRWREGCKFAHHLLIVHKDDRSKLRRVTGQLGHIYSTLLRDHARAAFWYRKTEQNGGLEMHQSNRLAECYFRLGNKQMAIDQLNRYRDPSGRPTFNAGTIKLLGEMGDMPKALQLAKILAGSYPDEGYLVAGDACRFNGQYAQALDFYDKVRTAPSDAKRQGRINVNRRRAAENAQAVRLFETLDLARIADGTYRGEAIGYAGPIKLSVTVAGGRIEAIKILEHREKQEYTALDDPREQIIAKQSVKGIDMTSGATITAEAVVNATAKALNSGMK